MGEYYANSCRSLRISHCKTTGVATFYTSPDIFARGCHDRTKLSSFHGAGGALRTTSFCPICLLTISSFVVTFFSTRVVENHFVYTQSIPAKRRRRGWVLGLAYNATGHSAAIETSQGHFPPRKYRALGLAYFLCFVFVKARRNRACNIPGMHSRVRAIRQWHVHSRA